MYTNKYKKDLENIGKFQHNFVYSNESKNTGL